MNYKEAQEKSPYGLAVLPRAGVREVVWPDDKDYPLVLNQNGDDLYIRASAEFAEIVKRCGWWEPELEL